MIRASPSSPYRIYVSPALDCTGKPRMSLRGPLCTASFDGEVIVSASVQPLFDACRILQCQGHKGHVEMWDHVRAYPRMRSTIEKAAVLTVEEGDGPPRFRQWKGFSLPGGQLVTTKEPRGRRTPAGLSKSPKTEPTAQLGGLKVTRP